MPTASFVEFFADNLHVRDHGTREFPCESADRSSRRPVADPQADAPPFYELVNTPPATVRSYPAIHDRYLSRTNGVVLAAPPREPSSLVADAS